MKEKLMNVERLKELLGNVRQNKKIVFIDGCFDLLHIGHVRCLKKAKEMGDILVVGIDSDDSVRKFKGEGYPVVPEAERAEMIAALECVDYVVTFSEDNPSRLIMLLRPDICVKAGDYNFRDLPEIGFVESYGGKVVIIEKQPKAKSQGSRCTGGD